MTQARKLLFLTLVAWSCLPLSFLQAEEDQDLDLGLRSLTNKVRAYDLRVQSLEDLSSHYPDQTFPVLVSLFKDPEESPSLRYLAAQKMGILNKTKTEKVFKEILQTRGEESFARKAALAELVHLNETGVKSIIREAIDNKNEDAAIRQYSLAVYSQWQEQGTLEKLRKIVGTKQETLSMRNNALFLLESLEDDDFVRTSVRQLLRDPSEPEELRRNCILIAQRLKDTEALHILNVLFQDPRESFRLRELAKTTYKNSLS